MTADDDDLDDASLKSMRAVWLSMRDEEPPVAGMSALLAAAREQAEQMRERPSWFARMFAMLRQPPALAFATVMILIGGAVVVTRTTSDQVDALVADEPRAQAETSAPAANAPAAEERREEAARFDLGADPEPQPAAAPPTERSPAPPSMTRPKPAPRAPARNAGKPADQDRLAKDKAVEEDLSALDDTRVAPVGSETQAGKGDAAGTVLEAPAPVARPPMKSPAPKAPEAPESARTRDAEPGTVTLSDGGGRRPATPSIEQLARQAESAASRGDCAAVREIVARIKKQDERFYKTRIEKHAALAKCR